MRRVHIPNLFYIQGLPHQGKSSLTRHFRNSLDCEVLQTDQIFWRWGDKYHYKETRDVRASLGRHFPYLPAPLRREWFEYLTNYVLAATRYARPDMVMEGWLLGLFPKDLKQIIQSRTTIMGVTMRRFVAHTARRSFKPEGSDYSKVVENLKTRMVADKSMELMAKVRQQRFEDCRHCAGRSDCAGRLAPFGLSADLRGKNVLEINCNTGYYAIRAAQRGAKVYAVDASHDDVIMASRIANAVYRLPSVRFYQGDIFTEDFKNPPKFDYVLAINGVRALEAPARLFQRAHDLLAPGGQFMVEVTTDKHDGDKTVMSWAEGFQLHARAPSVPASNNSLLRVAYTFVKEAGIEVAAEL